ncbi:neutral zinc metallopeptidase [Streptomyces ficellus]|uniref:Neutral zinc metallopeptidase n=1 Tax=Streptomyces ficellus TaxID=1977088 RepID=A0ABT7ZE44_9ACTN|nr:neutral zinc metallopeptidase [Streptomyces ficellus]MDN3297786.1 neutral zinc metallopeptidase [Streptomyces ficellus]
MQFHDDAGPGTPEVRDVRGRRALGGRVPGGGATAGGGVAALIALVLGIFFGVGPEQLGLTEDGSDPAVSASPAGRVAQACREGAADAYAREECRIVGVVTSVQDYWRGEYQRRGGRYTDARTVLFRGRAGTACGAAPPAVGPFYCPGDGRVHLDLGFFDELRTRSGATGGRFARAYVVAHEYGHHVQELMGTLRATGDGRRGAGGRAVRVELQADCYAGVWARYATRTPDGRTGRTVLSRLTDEDVRDGLEAAAAVGDGWVQRRSRGRVTPESWRHGSAEQRQRWFATGYRTGDTARCDTFR